MMELYKLIIEVTNDIDIVDIGTASQAKKESRATLYGFPWSMSLLK